MCFICGTAGCGLNINLRTVSYRELNGLETVLCLDFANCPQELKMNQKEWEEMAILLAISCNELGLANSVVWKKGKKIIGWMTLEQIE